MPSQLLVNVIVVAVPAGATAHAAPHGLRSNDRAVAPTLILPSAQSVVTVTSVDDTNVYLANPSEADVEVTLRCERGLSNEVDAETLTPFFQSVGTGVIPPAPVQSVSVTAPITNTGTASDPIIGASVGSSAGTLCAGNDARLSNERVPVDGSVTAAKVAAANKDGTAATPSMRTLGTGATQACAGNDARLNYNYQVGGNLVGGSGNFGSGAVELTIVSGGNGTWNRVLGKLGVYSFNPNDGYIQNNSTNPVRISFMITYGAGPTLPNLGEWSVWVSAGQRVSISDYVSVLPTTSSSVVSVTNLRVRMQAFVSDPGDASLTEWSVPTGGVGGTLWLI